MLNVVVLIGRLAQDPDARYTVNGTAVTNFTIAVDRPFTNRQGERDTDFIDVVCWRKLAETVADNLRKGRLVAVHGRMQKRSWEDQDGNRRYKTEVVADSVRFLDWPDDSRSRGRRKAPEDGDETDTTADDDPDDFLDDDLDDVPFD